MNPGITCRDLSIVYASGTGEKTRVLDSVNATFPSGDVSIITGPVGAGKTTLLNTLAGLTRPISGEVMVNDQAVSRWTGAHREQWRRQAGIIFQHYHLLHDLSVLENIMLPLIPLGYPMSKCRRQSMEALEKVTLLHHAGSFVNSLSGGERQKTAIARALVAHPYFIFADEPTAHMDVKNARQTMDLLFGCAKKNAVVIIATHELTIESLPGSPLCYHLENGVLTRLNP